MSDFVGTAPEQTSVPFVGTHTSNPDAEGFAQADAAGNITNKPGINKASVSKKLSKILPSRTPIDTFLRNIGNGTTKSDKYEFYSVISRAVKCVTKENAKVNGDTATITLESAHMLSKDGDLLVPAYEVANNVATPVEGDGAAMRPLVLHIIDINYVDKTITVVGVNAAIPAADTDAAIKAGVEMYRLAAAKDQDAAISDDPHAMPTKDFNICQRNLVTVSENAFQALQEKEVEYGIAEFKEQALFDFRWQAEMSSIFGAAATKGENFIDPITMKRKLHMRGLLDFNINNLTVDTGNGVNAELNTAMQMLFSGNNGSEERLFIYGPGVATILGNSDAWQKQLDASKTEVKWGVTWKTIETNFGILRGIMSSGFGLMGPYAKSALVIDPANIRRIEQIALHSRNLDLQKAGIRNTKDILLEEAWTLEVTNPQTHGFLQFK